MRATTAGLHVLQPLVRLAGRLRHGLAPWRRRGSFHRLAIPRSRTHRVWSEQWRSASERLTDLEQALTGAKARRGGTYERWDLEVRGGAFGVARVRTALEEHGEGRQLARMRSWPVASRAAVGVAGVLAVLAGLAFGDGAVAAAVLLAAGAATLAGWCLRDCAVAVGTLCCAIGREAEAAQQLADGTPNAVPATAAPRRAPNVAAHTVPAPHEAASR
jgi:hypothetical protein